MKKIFLSFKVVLVVLLLGISSTSAVAQVKKFSLEFFHDKQGSLAIEQVLKKNFKPIAPQYSLGINFETVWYKVTLTAVPQNQDLFLHNKLAYLSQQIEIYEVQNDGKFVKSSYNFLDSHVGDRLSGSSLVYPFVSLANEAKVIFIKNKAQVYQLIELDIYDKKDSIQSLINKNYLSNIIISCLFVLALYNAMIFIYNRKKEFLIYTLYLLNAGIGLFYLYGTVFHNFNIYGEQVYWLNITAILVSLFLALFIQKVFDTYHTCKGLHRSFNGVILLSLVDLMIAIFIDLSFAMATIGVIYIASFLAIIYLAAYFVPRKHPLIKVFIIAYVFYILGIIITLATVMGYVSYNSFTFHASGLGILSEAILFSYLLNFRTILLEKKVNKLFDEQKKLEFLAEHDYLTNIFNRRAFITQAESAISLAKRHNEPLSLIMIDLDFFKKVNDEYGHSSGDAVLFIFADRVKNIIRNEDIFGRIGGEEFSILLPKLTQEQALLVAEKLRETMASKPMELESVQYQQTISIGVTVLTNNDSCLKAVLNRADEALYSAKDSGRNRIVFQ